jgi:hypothetical protein
MKMQTRVLGILLAAGFAATPALAIPPALDHVPEETAVVVGVRDLSHLAQSMKHWGGMFAPEEAMGQLAMVDMILATPGVDASGSAAVAMNFPEGGGEPVPVLVVPVSDFEAFVGAMNGEVGEGVSTLEMHGEQVFAKDIEGDFIALGPDFDAVNAFDGSAGRLDAHETRLGETASIGADKADLFFVVDVQAVRPFIDMGLQQMEAQMGMAAMMGGEAVQAQMAAMMNAFKAVAEDGKTAFFGLGSGEQGLWLDFAAQFNEGTESAKVFAEGGDAGALLEKLPAMDYVAAFAMDTGSEGVRNLLAKASELGQNMSFGASMAKLAELHEGQATVIGVTPGLFAGGLFSNTVQYTASEDPEALLEGYEKVIGEVNGQTQQGLKLTTEFERDAAEADGTPLHAYSVLMEVDPNDENAAMASAAMQQMAMIFGGEGGPKGYVALTDDGMYQTMSRNTELVKQALSAEEGLDSNTGISDVREHLPESRTAEAYINVKGVTDMIAPMLAMMGGITLDEIPENLHPLAATLTTGEGGMLGRFFVPADVIEMAASLKTKFEGEDEWEEVEEEPESKPRF